MIFVLSSWFAHLLPRKTLPGFILGVAFLCGVCMFSVCLRGFIQVASPKIKNTRRNKKRTKNVRMHYFVISYQMNIKSVWTSQNWNQLKLKFKEFPTRRRLTYALICTTQIHTPFKCSLLWFRIAKCLQLVPQMSAGWDQIKTEHKDTEEEANQRTEPLDLISRVPSQ